MEAKFNEKILAYCGRFLSRK